MLRVAEAIHRTHTGRQREANEDSMFERSPVFAVADGMGGAKAGEVASGLAVAAFEDEWDTKVAPEKYLRQTVERANQEIFERAEGDRSRSGMGTTLTAAVLRDEEVSLGHVGDSRAYLFRDGDLQQLTNDHSLVEELRRQGKLTREQAAEHPQRSVITRALGPEPNVEVDTFTVPARPDDVFLLCSDGLTTMLTDERVRAILDAAGDLDAAARHLIQAANNRGGKDNITVVLFRLEDFEGVAGAAAAGSDDRTLVASEAEAEGLTATAVEEAVATERDQRRREQQSAAESRGRAAAGVESDASEGGRWRRRILVGGLGAFAVIAVLALGSYFGVRAVWFVGTDESGRISLYRGLPYELPFGAELYDERYSTPVTIEALPEARRQVAIEHELRSRDDAVSLIEDLQRAGIKAAAERPGGSGSGQGNDPQSQGSSSGGPAPSNGRR